MINELDPASAAHSSASRAPLPLSLAQRFDVTLDDRDIPGNRRAPRPGRWHDAFALGDERIAVSIGDLGGSEPGPLVDQLREALGAAAASSATASLGTVARLLVDSPAPPAGALVGILDLAEQRFTYVGFAYQPYLRYSDGTVAVLPVDPAAGSNAADHPLAQISVDLSGASLLLLITDEVAPTPDDWSARILRALADERLAHCVSPTAWLARRILDGHSHDGATLLALSFAPAASAAPPPAERPRWSVAWSFEATAPASNAVRRAFVAALSAKSDAARPVDLGAAELIFGEMIGNVVRHAPGRVDVQLEWTAPLPVLHVLDNGPGFNSRRRRERLPTDELSESGRGLFIINACAVDFSVRSRAGRGTHATATLALAT